MVEPSKNSRKIKKPPLQLVVSVFDGLNHKLAVDGEPMYDLTPENKEKLKSLLSLPFTSWGGVEKYRTLEEKAAAIFCLTIRGHKFGNGNKRTAVVLLLTFLLYNGKWLTMSWRRLYHLSMKVAAGTTVDYDTQIQDLAKLISKKLVDDPILEKLVA